MSLLERLGKKNGTEEPKPIFAERKEVSSEDQYQELKLAIHRRIVDDMNLEQQRILTSGQQERREVENIISSYCALVLEENPFAVPRGDRAAIIAEILDEILGLGPIEPLLKDETVTEIMINGPKNIYVERMGKIHRHFTHD